PAHGRSATSSAPLSTSPISNTDTYRILVEITSMRWHLAEKRMVQSGEVASWRISDSRRIEWQTDLTAALQLSEGAILWSSKWLFQELLVVAGSPARRNLLGSCCGIVQSHSLLHASADQDPGETTR
ncbi:hypothetical protein ACLQ25_30620, partial [Micromonospora sp. DT44]|uniref:hypothetical protein n=1 Tax=Micromonospora sp. DT44 TaxID=3393439 RepID=UPI003CE83CC1